MEKEGQEEGSKKLVRNDQIIVNTPKEPHLCSRLMIFKKKVGERRFELESEEMEKIECF